MERMIELSGGRVHVTVLGSGRPLVLLPGFGCAAPALVTRPFAEALSARYRVVVYEPFGYGKSDPAPTPRTVENISDELRRATGALGLDSFAVAAHSIGGLYALYHMCRFPGEIDAFIALDTSVPQQFRDGSVLAALADAEKRCLERLRDVSEASTEEIEKEAARFLRDVTGRSYTGEELRQYEKAAVRYARDPTALDELRHMEENATKTEGLTVPDGLPALMLLARENTRRLPEWESWHRALCGAKTRLRVVDSDHYVHLERTAQVVRLIEELLG